MNKKRLNCKQEVFILNASTYLNRTFSVKPKNDVLRLKDFTF
ncbi:hypothetical protein N480_23750 [Pseudoalteromonas luteoviolacea S2607]|nr:hypothetical protein N480_23750 [Pseudoalteromonas luteoviolacea S2607]